jgi:hypothetical protein
LNKRSEEARQWASRALSAETGAYGLIKRDALLLASRLAVPGSLNSAVNSCKQAVDLVRVHTEDALLLAQTLGEYAVALWRAGAHRECFQTLQEAVTTLLNDRSEQRLWKSLFVTFGHALGYMSCVTAQGTPPTPDFAEPWQGMFLGQGTIDQLFDPNREAFLLLQVAWFADALGYAEESSHWNELAQKRSEEVGTSSITQDFDSLGVAHAIASENFVLAIELAFNSLGDRGSVLADQLVRAGIPNPEGWISRKSSSETTPSRDNRALLIAVLPISVHIGRIYLSDSPRARTLSIAAASACRAAGNGAVNQDLWERGAALFEQVFVALDWRELTELGGKFGAEGNTALANFCYLGGALGSGLVQSLYLQYPIMFFADAFHAKGFRGVYATTFVPFVETFWLRALDQSGFEFRMPEFTRRAVVSATELPFGQRIRAILKAVSLDLRAKATPQIQSWLDTYQC